MAAACRIVVSGVGTVSPVGTGNGMFWKNLIQGRSGVGYLESVPGNAFPAPLAAEIRDFNPLDHVYCRKFLKVMSRDIQLGVAAATLATQDAGLEQGVCDPDRLGVVFGAGRISTRPEDLVRAVSDNTGSTSTFDPAQWGEDNLGRIAPLWLLKRLPNMPACHVAIQHDARGPNNTVTSRDASALLALAEGVSVIERGAADAMIVGACSSHIHPVDLTKFNLFLDLTRRVEDPETACRPFDATRDGTVIGEGAAAFVIERLEHAERRAAPIYAEILGVGAGCDGADDTHKRHGRGVARAVQTALRRAGIQPGDIGHINADGKSTRQDDLVEARGYYQGLGDAAGRIPVTALKSYFGYCDAGSGAVELAGSLLALKHGEIPGTLNYRVPDPLCLLNVSPDPRSLKNTVGLCVNRTTMGQSAAAIIRAM